MDSSISGDAFACRRWTWVSFLDCLVEGNIKALFEEFSEEICWVFRKMGGGSIVLFLQKNNARWLIPRSPVVCVPQLREHDFFSFHRCAVFSTQITGYMHR